jgi:hypothetical protein
LWAPVVALFNAPWNQYISISIASGVGFWIWFGWGWHCLTGRFPLVSPRTFWTISFITHLVWLAILVILLSEDAFPLLWFGLVWIVANVIVAFVGLHPRQVATARNTKM